MSPPGRAAAPAGGTEAGEQSVNRGDRQGQQYPHDPARCATCAGVQHRDVIADLWWGWGVPYRLAVAA